MNTVARRILMVAAVVAAVGLAEPLNAQVFTGRIDVVVVDQSGAILPGVVVQLSGPASSEAISDERGEARFLNLAVGTYKVAAKLGGFADYLNTAVVVVSGQSVNLRVAMKIATQAETVQVLGETPVIDTKKQTTATNVTIDELQNIPSARDPWVVMQTVPGIVVDRVNVGGSESGQQSSYVSKGADDNQNTWNLDGIPITDMGAVGSTPTYYDFDMFQEMNVTTGGADVSNVTPGVSLNFILKSGGDVPHGSARFFFEDESMQSNNISEELQEYVGGEGGEGNRTEKYKDYGFEVGGPLVKEKWWAWGSYGKTDVTILTLINTPDKTVLENYAFKTTAQVGNARPSFTYFRGNKEKFGRDASPTRPDETTWDQTGPTDFYKGEVSYVAGNNLFLVGRYAHMESEFSLTPRGGLSADYYRDADGVFHGTFYYYGTQRPQDTIVGEGNWFKNNHEVKFGYYWRRTPVDSVTTYPGRKMWADFYSDTEYYAYVQRDSPQNYEGNYQGAWIGDTMTFDRWTLTGALRWDRSTSSLTGSTLEAHPTLPEMFPAITTPEVRDAIKWNTLSPRVGMSYALTEDRKTIARASYAMFAGQLAANDSFRVAGIVPYAYVYYYGVDANGNNLADPEEVLFDEGYVGYYAFDPENPTSTTSVNRIGSDLAAPKTHEFIAGFDHEVVKDLGVSASLTYRYFTGNTWFPLIGVRSPDFVQAGTVEGSVAPVGSYSTPFYVVRDGVTLPPGLGREWVNREGYHQSYWGFEVSATKRLSNRWMGRVGFSTNSHTEYFDDPATSLEDPTSVRPGDSSPIAGPNIDGGLVATRVRGSGKSDIYIALPKYQLVANGFYQGPWGLNFGANYVMRQGYPTPYFARTVTGDPVFNRKRVLIVDAVDAERLPMLQSFDIRIEWDRPIGKTHVIVDFDVFNLFNLSTVLGREYDQARSTFYDVQEIMQPRIARIGVRFRF